MSAQKVVDPSAFAVGAGHEQPSVVAFHVAVPLHVLHVAPSAPTVALPAQSAHAGAAQPAACA